MKKTSMGDSKLIEILSSLSESEFKRFGKFIKSSFHNESPMLIKLYEFFKNYYPDTTNIYKEDIGNFIYSDGKEYDTKLRKLLSEFTKILENFILYIEIETNKFSRNNLLLTISHRRNLSKTFDQTLTDYRKENEKLSERDSHYFFRKYNIELESFRFLAGKFKNPEIHIRILSESVDDLFLFEKLICIYNITLLRNSFNKEVKTDLNFADEIIQHIEKNEDHYSKNKIIIYAYYLSCMMALKINETEYFFKYKKFILKNHKQFSSKELETFYMNMYSYSIQKVNKGEKPFLKEMMDVYKFTDKNADSIKHMFGFNIYYLNAINTGMTLKEFDWVERFIHKYKRSLPEDVREDVFNLGMANFYFFKRNYDEALSHLIKSDYPNYTYYLMAKVLMIKIYFEKKDFEGVLTTIDAMKHFLKRKDLIPERLIKSNLNFLNCIIKLCGRNKKSSVLNAEMIANEDMSIANRDWLLEKIREF